MKKKIKTISPAIKNKLTIVEQTAGFTLIELMIALLLSSIITAMIFTAFRSQEKNYETQEQIIDIQQNLRAALEIMSEELRMAAYNPYDQATVGFSEATETKMVFDFVADWDNIDNDNDGTTDEFTEVLQVTYELSDIDNDGDFDLVRQENDDVSTKTYLAENISRLEFFYNLEDGTSSTTLTNDQYDDVRSVQISILAQSAKNINITSNKDTYTTGSGAVWQVLADGYRKFFTSKTIYCRNVL